MNKIYSKLEELKLVPFDTEAMVPLDTDDSRESFNLWNTYKRKIRDLNKDLVLNSLDFELDLLKWNIENSNESYHQYYKLYCGFLENDKNASKIIQHTLVPLYKEHLDDDNVKMQISALTESLNASHNRCILEGLYSLNKNFDISDYFSTYSIINILTEEYRESDAQNVQNQATHKAFKYIFDKNFIFENYIKNSEVDRPDLESYKNKHHSNSVDEYIEVNKLIAMLSMDNIAWLDYINLIEPSTAIYTLYIIEVYGLDDEVTRTLKTKIENLFEQSQPEIYKAYKIAKEIGFLKKYVCGHQNLSLDRMDTTNDILPSLD